MILRRERLETPDGDFLDLDFTPDPHPDRPLVLILHGLEGSTRRRYVRLMLAEIEAAGMAGVALNFRGCSGEPNRAPRAYHSGETGDTTFVLEALRRRYARRPLGAVGYSLGGNVVLKLLGEGNVGERVGLEAAVAISVPYDLDEGARIMESTGWGRTYSFFFLRSLRRKVRDKADVVRGLVDVERALGSLSIRAFDDAFTAPLHGFDSASQYYEACSARCFLATIGVPALLLHALDDPFLPSSSVPVEAIRANPRLTLGIHATGGHVGFIAGSPWSPAFWAEAEAARYLRWHMAPTPAT
jgi:hypothetical protein